MKFELLPFQQQAVDKLRLYLHVALGTYKKTDVPQVISFTAPTGAGKTIMLASLVESVYHGNADYPAQSDAIFVWLSDSPELNKQSCDKFLLYADGINHSQLVMIDDNSFNQQFLDDGKIYFLNTQKLGKSSNLTKHSEKRAFTIWQTLQNTIAEKTDRIYFIIDEAHRGMQGTAAGRATTIMQKFIKGSNDDNLSPVPLVIGMSATPERFNNLVKESQSTIHRVIVTNADVKNSGLLKERIIVIYPDEKSNKSIAKDMAILEAAADEWKLKCEHWSQYLRDNAEKIFQPIFVIQVENSTANKISATDIDDCLKKISERTGIIFEVGQVVHTFRQTQADLMLNNLRVPYAEPASISGNDNIRVVFFKENLSTGWDCPQAETMMSFRRAVDATYIAQLLGRMIRTPLQHRIDTDDTLNEVHLFLPYFDPDTVQKIVDAFRQSEGESIPTEIIGEDLNNRKLATLTVKGVSKIPSPSPRSRTLPTSDDGLFAFNSGSSTPVTITDVSEESTATFNHVESSDNVEVAQVESAFDREEIVHAVNHMALTTYKINSTRIHDYLKSLFQLANFLMRSGLSHEIFNSTLDEVADFIRSYIEKLKRLGSYDSLHREAREFKLATQIFDTFGKPVHLALSQDLFVTSNSDIERQLNQAEFKLKNMGVSNRYIKKFTATSDDIDDCKIDVILFAKNPDCLDRLNDFARKKFHSLNDSFRRQTVNLTTGWQHEFDKIVSNSDSISKHNFYLPETIAMSHDNDGKPYSDHLFVDKKTGTATIKLNGWEEATLTEERSRSDFVCWLRNPPNKSWALCIPYYNERNEVQAFYPDFLIIRRDDSGFIVDILEPHDPNRRDNIGKAKGLANYAKENISTGRIQLIRGKFSSGQQIFKRLDLAKSSIRDLVSRSNTNNELDNIFEQYSENM